MNAEVVPFHEVILGHSTAAPDAVAVEFTDQTVTYRVLAERSRRLAARLRAHGVGPDVVVGVAVDRSVESVVAALSVLCAGGAWVPLDPSYPRERLAYMVQDSGIDLLVADEHSAAALPTGGVRRIDPGDLASNVADPVPVAGDNLAYMIYTSGSTGRPKGVLLTHGGLTNLARAQVAAFGVPPEARVLQFAPTSFDASVFEMAMALYVGATLVLTPRAAIAPGPDLSDTLRGKHITHVTLPPSVLATLPAEPLPDLAVLVCAGEALPAALARRWGRDRRLFNAYGPTETTVWATLSEVDPYGGRPPIGRAIAGVRVAVLDGAGQPVPDGQAGELAIGGRGVARAYHARPALTAERFVPDPGGEPGARLYRSGDTVRRLPGGDLEYLGRIDHQIKLGGHRIEPDEVAVVLAEHPLVSEAVVVPRGTGDNVRLVAYAVSGQSPAVLRAFLADRLPAYLVPAVVVVLDVLPLTPSGKVDRAALPEPDRASAGLSGGGAAARTSTERVLAGFVAGLLDSQAVGVDDDFFALGGSSLLAGRLAARIRAELGRELPIKAIYAAPTIAGMAALLDAGTAGSAGEAAPHPPPLIRADRDGPIPLSLPQERIWFLERLAPGNLAYNAQATIRLRGRLDVAALRAALDEIVRRHEIFRTAFVDSHDGPVQKVLPIADVSVPLVDLSGEPEPVREERVEAVVRECMREPFDLARPPLARWTLIRHADDDHTMVHVEHHMVHDGWSFALFLGELGESYQARVNDQPSTLATLACQYADFATWQRAWMRGDVLQRQLAHWTRELAGGQRLLTLPTDRPRPRSQSFAGAALRIELPAALCRRLREFSRGHAVTLYSTMLAGFAVVLSRHARQDDLVIGSGVANRRLAETERMIGMVVNTLPLRVDLSGRPCFDTLVRRVRDRVASAHEWQDVPLDRLVEALEPVRDASRNPLFQAMFSFHDTPVPELSVGGLTGTVLERHNGSAKTDLNIVVIPRAGQRAGRGPRDGRPSRDDAAPITLIWEYATSLFDEETMRRMVAHYITLLGDAVDRPGRAVTRLSMMDDEEVAQAVHGFNDTAADFPADKTIPELFAAQAAARPDAPAVVFQGAALSYADLDARSSRLAWLLRRRGVGCDTPVGVMLERDADMIVVFVAVLKAGGAYVPLDPGYPAERLGWMLGDSRVALVVTRSGLADRLPPATASTVDILALDLEAGTLATLPAGAPALTARPDSAAYVLYTSGSTGRPKGVVVAHRSVLRLVCGTDYVRFGPDERLAQVADASFDAITFEVWGALLGGGAVCVIPPEVVLTAGRLGEELRKNAVSSMFLTSALFNEVMASYPDSFAGLTNLLVGGDALDPGRIRQLLGGQSAPRRLLNGYGPTEATTFAVVHHIEEVPADAGSVPIGRPIANTMAYVLDDELQPVPIGVAGELYLGGPGVARGYADRPALTADRFIPNPFAAAGSRLYRTGDLVRRRTGGVLDFVGRVDDQVKISGFRIEPGEVEATLTTHPGVANAAVVVSDAPTGKRLIGYVVPAAGATLSVLELRAFLAERLPPYLVPAAYVSLPALPLTDHGKVDRAALPRPEVSRPELDVRFLPPRDETERRVAEICAGLLGIERVGVEDDFFVLGGHSLLAMRLVSRINEAFGADVPLRRFFQKPTVASLASALAGGGGERGGGIRPGDRRVTIPPDDWRTTERLLANVDALTTEQVEMLLSDFATDGELAGEETGA